MPAGRPSKFKETYCNEVITHMAEGASLTSFAAEIGVARSTINEWMAEHPQFSEACARGKAKCAAWWEKANRKLALTGEGNQGACKLGLTNMAKEDWSEKVDLNHGGQAGNPIAMEATIRFVRPGDVQP
jgi:hypothetical protein